MMIFICIFVCIVLDSKGVCKTRPDVNQSNNQQSKGLLDLSTATEINIASASDKRH